MTRFSSFFLRVGLLFGSVSFASAADSVVVINEIHYHPASAAETEWVELRNNQGVDVNLGGWQLTGGVEYTFPVGSFIPGGGYVTVAANPGLLAGSVGPFTGVLDNGGETLRLRNLNGRIMDEVTYDDENDWPLAPDGGGVTLARKAYGAESQAEAWKMSLAIGGTPGAQNFSALAYPFKTTAVPLKSDWRFLDGSTVPAESWLTTGFDDSTWPVAKADFQQSGSEIGHFSVVKWTGDADSGISTSKTYTHKVDLNHGGTATVINGVTFDNFNAPASALYVGPNGSWTMATAGTAFASAAASNAPPRNNMANGTGSWQMLNEFYYTGALVTGSATSVLTVNGLTPGQTYVLTCYAMGWDARDTRRVRVTPSNTKQHTIIDEGAFGQGTAGVASAGTGIGALQLKYAYKAPASGSLSLEFQALNYVGSWASWHHYGFSNEVAATALPVEEVSNPLPTVTVASVSSSQLGLDAVNTVNQSGLQLASGNHTNAPLTSMWLSTAAGLPATITYDLGTSQSLTSLRVWNYNDTPPALSAANLATYKDFSTKGAKDVEILVSPDASGETFTSAGTVQFPPGSGSPLDVGARVGLPTYQTNVRRVRLNITSNWGDATNVVGLSEVQFLKPLLPPTPQLQKTTIPTLYNTGVDNNNLPLAAGTADPHWTSPGGSVVIATNGAWHPAGPNEAYLAPNTSGSFPVGNLEFSTTFDLTNFVPGTEDIRFTTSVDDRLLNVQVNGVNRGISTTGFGSPAQGPFRLPGPFLPGVNTLKFIWGNASTAGAAGLRVRWDAKAALNTTTATASDPITSYYRRLFSYQGNLGSTYLGRLRYTVDDAAVFYLNGVEIHRTNISGAVTPTTPADSEIGIATQSGIIDVAIPSLNPSGNNVLAVEVHQGATGFYDLTFDAQFELVETPAPPAQPSLVFHEIAGASDANFFVELKNAGSQPLNTAGWSIVSSPLGTTPSASYAFPSQILAPGEIITLSAAALGLPRTDGVRYFLKNGNDNAVADAREVTNRLRGAVPGNAWGHPTNATPGMANTATIVEDVVINEIFYNALNDGAEQWIELYNKGATPVDLSGWKFSDGVSYDFPATPPTVLTPGQYLVVAWNPSAFAALHPAAPPALGPWTGSLSGKGEKITLRDANDNLADQLTYSSSGRWSEWADGGGSSLELKNPHADNTAPEAWDASDESAAAPWVNVSYSGLGAGATTSAGYTYYNELVLGMLDSGEVLVDDIVVSESGGATRAQLIQNGDFTSGTSVKWRNIGTHRFTSIVDDPLSAGNKVMKIVATGATEPMNNNCSTTLKDGATYVTTSTTNTYTISFRAKWVRGSNRLLSRLYFNRLPKQTELPRPATGGTPGAANSRFVANAGPTYANLSVGPAVPATGIPASVSIAAADADGLASVELLTSINGGAFTTTAMTPSTGGYSATVPGQAAGTLVQFYVRGTDTAGNVTTYPKEGPASRCMIPWEDGKTISLMPSGAKVHNVRLVMPAADALDMYLAENVMSNWYRPCTFILNDSIAYYHASARIKSSEHGRFQEHRAGFNVKFGDDQPFLGTHTTISLDRSGNLSNEGLDGTGISSQREILIKSVMNAVGGVYSQEDDLVRMIAPVASGTPAPRFSGVNATGEAILSKSRFDREYLENQWTNGNDGTLFKQEYVYPLTATIDPVTRVETGIAAGGALTAAAENHKVSQTGGSPGPAGINLAYVAPAATGNPNFAITDEENFRWHWLIRNGRSEDNYAGIISAITAVGQATASPAFKAQTEATLDVDTWMRSAAIPMMFMVTDNYLGSNAKHNAIVYFPPGGKGILIPWDCDFLNVTTANATSWSMTAGADMAKFLAYGDNKRRYWCHVQDILNKGFNATHLTRWANHYSRFGPDNVSSTLSILLQRATHVQGLVNAAVPATSFAVLNSPATATTAFTTVTGDGWLDIDAIRLQGSNVPLTVTWTDENSWSIQLPLRSGNQSYTLEAVRKNGTLAGTATFAVNASGAVFPAGPGDLLATEVNYNPPGTSDAQEFIEIMNITGDTLDLSRCHFDDNGQGISYTFANGTSLASGARLVIARDLAAFAAAYPTAPVPLGPFIGALDNSGEQIVLYSAAGAEIFTFAYTDEIALTDGDGRSLVRVLGQTPLATDYTWRASETLGGNPATTDALPVPTGSLTEDADGDGHSVLLEYAFGTSDTEFNEPNQFLVPNGTEAPQYQPLPNADGVILQLEVSHDLIFWQSPTPDARGFWRLRATRR